MKYQHIVFDVDGTLVDNAYAILRSLQETIREFTGKTYPMEELTFCLGIPGVDTLKQLEIQDINAAFNRWVLHLNGLQNTAKVFDGIKPLLEQLQQKGFQLGIVTSRKRAVLDQDLPGFGIRKYFGTVICEDDSEKHKPNPDPLLAYMAKTGAEPSQILYIGDSVYDCRCAAGAGCDFVLAYWGARKHLEGAKSCLHPLDILELCK